MGSFFVDGKKEDAVRAFRGDIRVEEKEEEEWGDKIEREEGVVGDCDKEEEDGDDLGRESWIVECS